MSKTLYNLAIGVGQYTDKNGNSKTKWENIGSIIQSDNGKKFLRLRRTFSPAGMPVDDKFPFHVAIPLFDADER